MLEYFSLAFHDVSGQMRAEVDSEQFRYWTRTMEKYSFLGAITDCLSNSGQVT